MSYEVIAQKWRPQSFHQVMGQEHVIKTLQNQIRLNRIGHAYLFWGPRGTGKTTVARLADLSLNTVVKIESDVNKNPTIDTLSKIAKALDVDDLIQK